MTNVPYAPYPDGRAVVRYFLRLSHDFVPLAFLCQLSKGIKNNDDDNDNDNHVDGKDNEDIYNHGNDDNDDHE